MRRSLVLGLLILHLARPAMSQGPAAEVVLKGGTVLDGTGTPGRVADVGLRGDRIVAVGTVEAIPGAKVIDASGLVVAPGFIDLHSHSDTPILRPETRSNRNFQTQGVTTVVTGNCGGGALDVAEYFEAIDRQGAGTNVIHLIPHGRVRASVLDNAERAPDAAELARMKELVERGMRAGAWGMSTGLIYLPGRYAEASELVELSRVVARHGGLYASHIRNEGTGLLEAIDEALTIGREAGLPVHISHLKASGKASWGLTVPACERIVAARKAGQAVSADQYPYVASSTSLAAMVVPAWAIQKGTEGFGRIADDPERGATLRREIEAGLERRNGGASIRIARYAPDLSRVGRDLAFIAREEGTTPVDVVLDIQRHGGAQAISFSMSEDDVRQVMRNDFVATASDGSAHSPKGEDRPHPRSYGTFPRKIRYALDEKVITLEQAIRSCSGLPAEILHLPDRGVIRPGTFADVVVFDPRTFRDAATFDEPTRYAPGVAHLFVNGVAVIADGQPQDRLPGRALRLSKDGASGTSRPGGAWLPPANPVIRLVEQGGAGWKVVSDGDGEFTLDSAQEYDARPGDTFAVNVKIHVQLHTKALPELVCYDGDGREVPARSSLENAANYFSTNWQEYRRTFVARPGTASVRARIRGVGHGEVELAALEFRPVAVDPYQTGMLVEPLDAFLRKGIVLESNFGIVNEDRITDDDRDGDGLWALSTVDLDRITEPRQQGEDWRSRFEVNPNAIFWSDGAVLKSDTVREDRSPDPSRALHFRSRVRPGPYRVLVGDPGRAVAVSTDGRSWRRCDGGREIDLGTLDLRDGLVEFWLDDCFRDPISVGPAYFDYVRLLPAPDPASVDRLVQAAVQHPGKPDRGSVEAKRVEITVRAPRFAEGGGWPVRCGLPIPRGELASADRVAVESESGGPVPSQARAMATWPDGSVKWLAVDFRHDLRSEAPGRYRVAYGNRIRPANADRSVTIRREDDGLEVDTGAVQFRVPRARFGVVDRVRRADGRVVLDAPIAAEVVEAGGRTWPALDLPVRRLEVEQEGPLHAVIVAETGLPPSGEPSAGFAHRARIHAYAGSPLLHIEYFVANVDSRPAGPVEGSMASKVDVRSVAWRLRPAGRIARVVTEAGPATAGSGALVQKDAEVAVVEGKEQTRHLAGWAAAALEGGGTVALGVEGFREQFPKALRWRPDGLDLDLWASEGGDFEWIEGVGKTHHLSLYFGESAGDAEVLSHGRVLAFASPAWYCASGAFGPIGTAAGSPLPEVERTLARHMAEDVVGRVGLGFENYGDHSSGGYVKGTFLWDNNEYDVPAACFVHFARTGDSEALRVGLASALHYVDVDTVHYSSRHADWAAAQHVHSHGTFGHHTAQGPDMSHAGYVQGLIWSSYLTGEAAGLEGARGIASWVLRKLGLHTIGMERMLGHPLMTLNDLYEATWDERWLRGSATLVDQALKWEHPRRGGFLAPITESPAYYSGSPFNSGLVSAALLKFNGWAHQPDVDRLLERVADWTLTEVWRPPAGVQDKGGTPRRRGAPQHIASHLRLMATLVRSTGDPIYLAVPRRSVLAGFGARGKLFGTRSTGLVFNYLPWFLEVLDETGDPSDDAALALAASPSRLAAPRGVERTVSVVLENRGQDAITDLRLSCRGRRDFEVVLPGDVPRSLGPGERREVAVTVRTPRQLNLTGEANRRAYVHFAVLYRRDGHPRVGHVWSQVDVGPD